MKSGVALALALAVVLAAVPISVHAGAQPHMIFGSVGIGRGQTARLNITNIADADSTRAVSCEVALGFVDGNNQMLLPAIRVALQGSRSTHVDVSMNHRLIGNPDLRPGQRLAVRAIVGVVSEVDGACDAIVGSVEIIDNATNATTAIMSPLVYSGFNPQPDIPGIVGSILGISGGQ
jgi:hypothetical protein